MALPQWHPPAKLTNADINPGTGELTKEPLHAAVGSALDSWEKLEVFLAHLFDTLVEARTAAAMRAYGTIQGTQGRRQAIEAAASSFFRFPSDPLIVDIFTLANAYFSASTYRNNIAHGITISMTSEVNGLPIGERHYLVPPPYNTRKWPLVWTRAGDIRILEIAYVYRAKDIKHCEVRFEQLATEAEFLTQELKAIDSIP
jgi:hypothetical protein